MIIHSDGDPYPTARCDYPDCTVEAPRPGEWCNDNPHGQWPGWNNLGWHCFGGTHLCPKHAPKK